MFIKQWTKICIEITRQRPSFPLKWSPSSKLFQLPYTDYSSGTPRGDPPINSRTTHPKKNESMKTCFWISNWKIILLIYYSFRGVKANKFPYDFFPPSSTGRWNATTLNNRGCIRTEPLIYCALRLLLSVAWNFDVAVVDDVSCLSTCFDHTTTARTDMVRVFRASSGTWRRFTYGQKQLWRIWKKKL